MPNVGIDASMLEKNRTGIGNYVFNLLVRYRRARPDTPLFLFSNGRVSDEVRTFACRSPPSAPPRT